MGYLLRRLTVLEVSAERFFPRTDFDIYPLEIINLLEILEGRRLK